MDGEDNSYSQDRQGGSGVYRQPLCGGGKLQKYKEKNKALERDIPQLQEIVSKVWKKEDELTEQRVERPSWLGLSRVVTEEAEGN